MRNNIFSTHMVLVLALMLQGFHFHVDVDAAHSHEHVHELGYEHSHEDSDEHLDEYDFCAICLHTADDNAIVNQFVIERLIPSPSLALGSILPDVYSAPSRPRARSPPKPQ